MRHKQLSIIIFLISIVFSKPLFSNTLPSETINGNQNGINEQTMQLYMQAQKELDSKACMQKADRMWNISSKKNDIEGQLLSLIIKEEHYMCTDRPDSMQICINKIKEMTFNSSKYSYYYFRTRYWLGHYYIYKHHYAAALNEIKSYQELAIKMNNNSGIGLGYKLMGDLLLSQKKFNSAFTLYQRGYKFLHEHGSLPDEIVASLAIGKYYYNNGQYDDAIKHLLRAGSNDYEENIMMEAYSLLASCYAVKGDFNSADTYFDKVNYLVSTHTMFPSVCDVYNTVKANKALIHDKNVEDFLKYCNRMNDPLLKLYYKAKLYASLGDYKKSYQYSLERDAVRDSLDDIEEVQLLASYQSKFEYNVLVNEKDKLVRENMSLELRDAKAKELILWVSLVGILLIGVAYTLYRRMIMKRLNEAKDNAEKAKAEADEARAHAEKAQTHAEQADQLKTIFLQNMSHEIRTPLNAIIGFNEILNNEETCAELSKEEKSSFVKMIETNSDLLLTLVNDILDLSKLESGTYKRVLSEISLSDLCKTVVESVRGRVEPGVELILNCNPEHLMLRTDALRLQQVLTNLLTNAAKYTTQGFISVEYAVENGKLILSVSDSGTGIKKEDRERIFNRFEKLDSFKQGTGLGLNICSGIADLLNGKIYIDPNYENGSRFVFEHPLDL